MNAPHTPPSRRFSRADPAMVVSTREARNAAMEIRDEVKRLRAQHKATIKALQQRRRELIAQGKAARAARRAEFRQAIADLRAAMKESLAAMRAELRARLKDINDEIKAERAELRGLTPAAKEELRRFMLRGEDLKSAKARLAGQTSAQKRAESAAEALDSLMYEIGVDRFRDSHDEMRKFLKHWLARRAPKGADTITRLSYYDPKRKASAAEQWREWVADNEHEWQLMQDQWSEAAVERELSRMEASAAEAHAELERLAHDAHETLQTAARCADPWTYEDLEQLHAEIPTVSLTDDSAVRQITKQVRTAIDTISTECKPRAKRKGSKGATPAARKVRRAVVEHRKGKRAAPLTAASLLRTITAEAAQSFPPGQVRLSRLAKLLGDRYPRAERLLLQLNASGKIGMGSEDNTPALTAADRAAAIKVGGELRHYVITRAPRGVGRRDYAERREARVDRLQSRAAKKASDAEAHRARADAIGQRFEMGQPIILDHHSTKRALRDRERMDNATRAAVREQEEAQALARRAAAAEGNKAISSDDPRAAEKLSARIDADEALLELAGIVRGVVKRTKTAEERATALAALGLPARHELIRFAMADPINGSFPTKLPGYFTTNLSANIRRMKTRLAGLHKLAATEEMAPKYIGTHATLSEADNRIQLHFNRKPEPETIAALKRSGFHWSKAAGAWQRKVTHDNRQGVINKAREIAQTTVRKKGAAERVVDAYDDLKRENGLRNQRVYELAERAGMTPTQLHGVLGELWEDNMVNPSYGEPTAVSAAERNAAWVHNGVRYMLVEIANFG